MVWVNPTAYNNGDPLTLVLANQLMVDNPQYLKDHMGAGVALLGFSRLSSPAAMFSFTGLSQIYSGFGILLSLRSTQAANSVAARLRINNDTGSNYDYTLNPGTSLNNNNYFRFGSAPGASAAPAWFSACRIEIPEYTAAKRKSVLFHNIAVDSSANVELAVGGGFWSGTAAIDRIDIYPSLGDWAADSMVALIPWFEAAP